ncbi:MAG: hypothetical protein JXQ30_08675 [Spirochaetes bacterium]|nr:hypothetical protein [Spirochaetota bacterium]
MDKAENNIFGRFADALNDIAKQQKINTDEMKKLDQIEEKLDHISEQVNNHIPTEIKDVNKKVDKVIDGQEKMWPTLCDLEKGVRNLVVRLMRRNIIS